MRSMKHARFLLTAFLLVFFGASAHAVSYPEPVGFVNDFANLLSEGAKKDIGTLLAKYERETSIEIAVVTVSSLQGLTVEDYTIRLAESWGVGKKKKDNGIVLLVAPQERKVRIEVGYGLEPELTDAAAGQIIQNVILPAFKAGKMEAGVVSGVRAIVEHLGAATPAERAGKRQVALEEAREDRAALIKTGLIVVVFFGLMLALGGIIVMIFLTIKVRRERQELLRKHKQENETTIARCENALKKAEKGLPAAKRALAVLEKEHPRTVWRNFAQAMSEYERWSPGTGKLIVEFRDGNKESNVRNVGAFSNLLKPFLEKCEKYALISAEGDALLRNLEQARRESTKFLTTFSNRLKLAQKSVDHEDSGEKARTLLAQATKRAEDAGNLVKNTKMVDWFAVVSAVNDAENFLQAAKNEAEGRIEEAARAKKEGPVLLTKMPEMISQTETRISKLKPSSGVREKLTNSKDKYAKARHLAGGNVINWMLVFVALAAAKALLEDAESDALREKRRRDDDARSRARRSQSDSYSSGSSYSGSSSSSSDSFGGFGGGSFGGGGATGSW